MQPTPPVTLNALGYQTGFDDPEFLPIWLSNGTSGSPAVQSSEHALSKPYSCRFDAATSYAQTYIITEDLDVPSGSERLVTSFAVYPVICWTPTPPKIMRVEIYEDGQYVTSYPVDIRSVPDIDGWYPFRIEHVFTHPCRTCMVSLRLEWLGTLGPNLFVDNFAINFFERAPVPTNSLVVYGDKNGGTYGLDQLDGTKCWGMTCGQQNLSSTLLVLNNVTYIASGGNPASISAIDVQTGKEIWCTDLVGSTDAMATNCGDLIVVASSNGYVYGIRKNDGGIVWQVRYEANRKENDQDFINDIVSDGRSLVYLATTDGIYAMNATTQQSLWFYRTPGPVPFAPVFTDTDLFYGDQSGSIGCLSRADGKEKWGYCIERPINSAPCLVGGIVAIGTDNGYLIGYGIADGAEIWCLEFPDEMVRSFTIDGTNIYVSTSGAAGKTYCYSYTIDDKGVWHFTSGWKNPLPLGALSPPVTTGSLVLLTASDTELYAMSKSSGTMSWEYSSGVLGYASPALVPPTMLPPLSRRYDKCCFVLAHNAYANSSDGWWYMQQTKNIPTQLSMGARGLELDIYLQDIGGKQEIVYNHAGCANVLMAYRSKWKLLRDSLREIGTWLANNPNEVVTIVFEQGPGLGNPDPRLSQAFKDGGVDGLVFYANQTNVGTTGAKWNVDTQGWPTLQWLVDNGKRLVVFSQAGNKGQKIGFPRLWDYAVENAYGTDCFFSGCPKRSESDDLASGKGKIFVVNYAFNMPTIPTEVVMPSSFSLFNNFFWVMSKIRSCQLVSGRLPNLVKINFFEYGLWGGPLQVASQINDELGR